MSTNSTPTYANLFVVYHKQILQQEHTLPKDYFRLIDDDFFIWKKSYKQLLHFMDIMNNMTPSLKLTWKVSQQEMEFLDLFIYKGEKFKKTKRLDIKMYTL